MYMYLYLCMFGASNELITCVLELVSSNHLCPCHKLPPFLFFEMSLIGVCVSSGYWKSESGIGTEKAMNWTSLLQAKLHDWWCFGQVRNAI